MILVIEKCFFCNNNIQPMKDSSLPPSSDAYKVHWLNIAPKLLLLSLSLTCFTYSTFRRNFSFVLKNLLRFDFVSSLLFFFFAQNFIVPENFLPPIHLTILGECSDFQFKIFIDFFISFVSLPLSLV